MEKRTAEQIREHYEIEIEIARRLRNSTSADRASLYGIAYDELFRRVPHHPLLHNDLDSRNNERISKEVAALERFLTPKTVYLEIGPGDCAVAYEVSLRVEKAIAVDVSEVVTENAKRPDNFELVISDGIKVPVAPDSIDFAYSNQLMEHLHPDDAFVQLKGIYNSLKAGGVYYCVTPNRLSGPHDISRNFDDVATCLHLHEFTVTELDRIFREVGFRRMRIYLKFGKLEILLPVLPYRAAEALLDKIPHRIRKLATFNKVVGFLLGVKMVAVKP